MRRAIGITRVSAEGDRETVHSYATQAERITTSCDQDGLKLLYVGQERNVSGGANLVNRPELSKAVEAVENGQADVIIAAYFDRFFRSLDVQSEVIRRIEQAGGEVLSLDHGQLTNATPAKRMTANIIGAISQYFREQTGQKTRDGHRAAVAAGKLPYPNIPLGYFKGADGCLYVEKRAAEIVRELFERRARDESIHALARWMTAAGHPKSTTGVRTILKNRVYLGEIHFGELSNTSAHEAIIDADIFAAAQRGTGKPGRPPLGEPRLLARLGVLRCECGASMALGSNVHDLPLAGKRRYYMYRCGRNPRCATGRKVTIQAPIAEAKVWHDVRHALRDVQGRASAAQSAQEAVSRLRHAQEALDTALRVFTLTGAENESAAVARLAELSATRDKAQSDVDQIGPSTPIVADVDDASFDERRAYIRAVVVRAVVSGSGRGADRVTVELRGE